MIASPSPRRSSLATILPLVVRSTRCRSKSSATKESETAHLQPGQGQTNPLTSPSSTRARMWPVRQTSQQTWLQASKPPESAGSMQTMHMLPALVRTGDAACAPDCGPGATGAGTSASPAASKAALGPSAKALAATAMSKLWYLNRACAASSWSGLPTCRCNSRTCRFMCSSTAWLSASTACTCSRRCGLPTLGLTLRPPRLGCARTSRLERTWPRCCSRRVRPTQCSRSAPKLKSKQAMSNFPAFKAKSSGVSQFASANRRQLPSSTVPEERRYLSMVRTVSMEPVEAAQCKGVLPFPFCALSIAGSIQPLSTRRAKSRARRLSVSWGHRPEALPGHNRKSSCCRGPPSRECQAPKAM
mmetsp:Transcript_35533/g.115071  ORF Transcript_35533/g.115071 Transcript_35533/m.115071 type:complete len:359 (+) Transcript_35533:1430-2506(+)